MTHRNYTFFCSFLRREKADSIGEQKALVAILIKDAYARGPSPRPRLCLIDDQTSLVKAMGSRPSTPPLRPSLTDSFYGWDPLVLANFLRKSDTKIYSLDYFFIADERTASDGSLLLVMVEDKMRTARFDVEMIPFDSLLPAAALKEVVVKPVSHDVSNWFRLEY